MTFLFHEIRRTFQSLLIYIEGGSSSGLCTQYLTVSAYACMTRTVLRNFKIVYHVILVILGADIIEPAPSGLFLLLLFVVSSYNSKKALYVPACCLYIYMFPCLRRTISC